ncbi:molybdenum cofactor guanylyltransferase [Luteimonas sp. SDU82]|uniref:molybdenum cofactor guanylyltransferase n=1 Tax=Luteimonas sp. SDU82 TaxID=3422592 RepID=UPI003EB6C2C5
MTGRAGGIARGDITFGILAGGRATRLGGRDKAWLERDGVAQVLRLIQRFGAGTGAVLVSANRALPRYAQAGIVAVTDRVEDAGPLGGLDALAAACRTPWLHTLPVDLVDANDCLLPSLASARGAHGARAQDDAGLQPLVALWRVDALRDAAAAALREGNLAVQALQLRLDMPVVRFAGVRFGNLNTPDDLRAAGIDAH